MPTPALIEAANAPPRKGHRRTRSAGYKRRVTTSPKPSRRLSTPLPLPPAPIYGLQPDPTRPSPNRHVSFVDSPPSTSRQNSASDIPPQSLPPPDSQLFSTDVTASPASFNASLPLPAHLPTPPPEEELRRCNSDSSRLSAAPSNKTPSTPVFRKLRLGFKSKNRKGVQSDKSPELPRTPELDKDALIPADPPQSSTPRKHSFIPPWSHSKKGAPTDPLACLETASTRSNCSLSRQSTSSKGSSNASPTTTSFTLLPKKPTRRTTAPIPRTMPYEAPYFATPPVLPDDSYSSYLRRLPQFEGDMHAPSVPLDSSHSNPNSKIPAPTRESRSLGASSRTRPVPKRRSASEDWSTSSGIRALIAS
jgi:hypothetical protein